MNNRLEKPIRYGFGAPLSGVVLNVCADRVQDRLSHPAHSCQAPTTRNLSYAAPFRGPSSSRRSSISDPLRGNGPAIQTP